MSLKKGVSPLSNNYTEELVGIQIGLEFLSELDYVQNRSIYILTDCQPAIKTAFGNQLPKTKLILSWKSRTAWVKFKKEIIKS